MNLRRMILDSTKEETYEPVDKGLYSKLYLYCYDENEHFTQKLDIHELHISLDYNSYGRQLITVSFKVWWEDCNQYIKNNTKGSFLVRYRDPNDNEIVLSDGIIKTILGNATTDVPTEFYEVELYTNKMDYFTKELTHIKF